MPNTDVPPLEGDGGTGGSAPALDGGTRDTRLLAQAIKGGWPVTAEIRSSLVRQAMDIFDDPDSGPRERIAVLRALIAANGQNIELLKLLDPPKNAAAPADIKIQIMNITQQMATLTPDQRELMAKVLNVELPQPRRKALPSPEGGSDL